MHGNNISFPYETVLPAISARHEKHVCLAGRRSYFESFLAFIRAEYSPVPRPIFENKCRDRSIMSAEKVARREGKKEKRRRIIVQMCGNLFGVVGRVREFSSGRDIE